MESCLGPFPGNRIPKHPPNNGSIDNPEASREGRLVPLPEPMSPVSVQSGTGGHRAVTPGLCHRKKKDGLRNVRAPLRALGARRLACQGKAARTSTKRFSVSDSGATMPWAATTRTVAHVASEGGMHSHDRSRNGGGAAC